MAQDIIRQYEIVDRIIRADGSETAVIAVNDDIGDGRPVNLRSMDLARYQKNPVVLLNHDQWEIPVGRSLSIKFDAMGRMIADFEFLAGDERAQRCKNAWRRGFLRAASIRARPKAQDSQTVMTADRQHELVEWSIVTVPADPDSVRSNLTRALGSVLDLRRDSPQPANNPESGEDMDETRVRALIKETLAANTEGETDEQRTERLSKVVNKVVSDALKSRDDANKKAEDEAKRAKDEKEKSETQRAEIEANAEKRADLLSSCRAAGILPKDFEPAGKSTKDILVAAAGEEVKDAKERSEDYLLAKVEGIIERRERAKNKLPTRKSGDGTKRILSKPLNPVAMRNLRRKA